MGAERQRLDFVVVAEAWRRTRLVVVVAERLVGQQRRAEHLQQHQSAAAVVVVAERLLLDVEPLRPFVVDWTCVAAAAFVNYQAAGIACSSFAAA